MSDNSFRATDDAGNCYTIHIQRNYINAGGLDDPHKRIEGLPSFRSNGGSVNKIDDHTFEIVATATRVRVVQE